MRQKSDLEKLLHLIAEELRAIHRIKSTGRFYNALERAYIAKQAKIETLANLLDPPDLRETRADVPESGPDQTREEVTGLGGSHAKNKNLYNSGFSGGIPAAA